MIFLKWLLIVALGVYALLGLVLYVGQRAMMYVPDPERVGPARAGFSEAEELVLEAADGERIITWHLPPRGTQPVILYFHGNGGNLSYRVPRFRAFADAGFGLLAVSYRGYGGSSGHPSETGLIADAAAAYAEARRRYPADRLVFWGESLGTGVSVALAAEQRVKALVLESPFASTLDIARKAFPMFPVTWLMKDQFRSDLRIAHVMSPVLVMHGARDAVVPIASGEGLYALANEPKRFVRFPDGAHNNLDTYGATQAALKFIGAIKEEW